MLGSETVKATTPNTLNFSRLIVGNQTHHSNDSVGFTYEIALWINAIVETKHP